MNIENKRILLVGKETYMYPFYYLIDEWSGKNEIATLWVNPMESELDECDLNSSTYYAFKRKGITKDYTLTKANEKFIKICNDKINYEELEALEKKYSHFKNINCQIISDQAMNGHYHYRTMNIPVTYEQQLNWIMCLYENIEEILDDFNPDYIFDCDTAELPRNVLNEVAYHKNIPYISIAYSKYELYKIPSYTLNIGVEEYFQREYNKCLQEADTEEEKKYVESFRIRKNIKNSIYMTKGNTTYCYKVEPLIDTLKDIYSKIVYFKRQDSTKKNRLLKKQNPYVFVKSSNYLKFWIRSQFFRRKLYQSKDYFENPVDGEPYIYMPLHLIPESTTFNMAPFWINELSVIEAASKALPAGWRLYVKEHQAMLGERGEDFYKKVKKIPNVRLVRFNYYDDPKPWIEKSKAVITITGTSAYEAALLGKQSFVLGDVPFSLIKGVTQVKNIEELPALFKHCSYQKNIDECAAYIKAVKNVGEPFDLEYVMMSVYENLVLGKKLESRFFEELNHINNFFSKAVHIIDEGIEEKA